LDKKTNNWQIKKLGEVFIIERGGSPRPIEDYITDAIDGINWIKIGDTKGVTKYITKTKEKIKPEGLKKSRMVYEGDFILSNSMSFGRPYIMKTSGCIHDGWLVIRKNEKINNDYLYYVLNSNQVYSQFSSLAKGSTVKNLNISAVQQVEIPLPPLETQHAIVSKIEELFSELDKGIAELKTAQQQLKTYRQSVLKSAFEGKLTNENVKHGELPDGWQWKTFNEIIEISKEKHKPVINEFKFYIGLEHIEKNIGKLTSHCGIEEIKTIKNKFKSGEILYGKLRPNLNKVYLTREEGVCSTDILVLKTRKNCNAKFLTQLMLGSDFVNTMSENTNGVNLPRVSTKFILEYKINLPPIEEQHQIVQEIESRLSVADKMEQSLQESLQKAEALRQSILKKAFSGELV
jgi:type I restriction enzyme S subunit